jgi:dTDP-4-dehydrorhamnose reductase
MPAKLLITGLGGTVAPALAAAATRAGYDVVGWNRSEVPPDDAARADAWLASERPDAIAHLAVGAPAWAGRLAAYAAERDAPFVFTSSAMVFHNVPDGPHAVHDERTAVDPYGRSKIACEDAIRAACPGACIARLGWQIDPTRTNHTMGQTMGNTMTAALDRWQAEQGRIAASRRWRPACSFLDDTVAALLVLLREPRPGVVHLDANAEDGFDFARIVRTLRRAFDRPAWVVLENEDYVHDQRLLGGCALVPPLSQQRSFVDAWT